ncbi:metallophosphoesterase [Rhizobium sp. 25PS6]|uniref:metallophosphoesterase n=1 Tax=Rhizobium sp. 25PS6 TaxID=3075622 RepID=UPI0028FD7EF5|nr:metallophosphoesterase [Rhizobium sp. 25PS6]MDU0362488.1 metallophosphoesterase [Rhizobium sp. 25PS6]
MRRIRILQVGDIHYPDWQLVPSEIDAKDHKFAPNISESLRSSAFRAVLRKLRHLASSETMNGVVFVGDFTSRGKSEFLEGAFRHFSLLCRGSGATSQTTPLLFVPGNHDVDRKDALELGTIEKFRNISQLAERFGWQPVPLDRPVSVVVGRSGSSMEILLVNTSVGSWELQNLPKFLRDKLRTEDWSTPIDLGSSSSIDDGPAAPNIAASPGPPGDLLDQYYNQLDTPYVSATMLTALMEHLLQPGRAFGVIVGHHNLLPQKTPRISPYAEMLNAGFVRTQILSANKPILYLHGHIHQDPIEVVSDPRKPGSQLISISAPEIGSGFNEIILFITDQDDLIGVRVIPYRTRPGDGTLVEEEHCFVPTSLNSRTFLDESTFALLRRLKEYRTERNRDLLFWNEVAELVRSTPVANALEDALIMLHASREIDIHGLNRSNRDWRIQVKGK